MSDTPPVDPTQLAYADGHLSKEEVYWRDHQKWLLENGYRLRPRFQPNWIPSWKRTDEFILLCEDAYELVYGQIIDAVCLQDGMPVALKKISKSVHPHETNIGTMFSSEPLVSDPRNHCVPIQGALQPPDDNDATILVMPLLHDYDEPRFDTFGEVIDFFQQVFKGLQFMHEHHVAHRDCNFGNIMMDAKEMFPEGFHPFFKHKNTTFRGDAKHLTRTERPPKYYLIDFGLSCQFDPSDGLPLEWPIKGGDKTVPEFKTYGQYDPFPTDVYYLGNMIREQFLQGHPLLTHIKGRHGFEFMRPLVNDMVQDDPKKRPTMDQVVARFEVIRGNLSSWKLRSRVVERGEHFFPGITASITHWKRRIRYIARRVPPIPQR